MAYRVIPFTSTIPAGTPIATPVTIPLTLDNWTIEQIDLEVPPGPSGLMGFQVYNNGVAWIPYGTGNWIVWDDHSEQYSLRDQPNGSGWAIVGYNLGLFPHSVTTRWHVNPIQPAAATAAPPTVTVVTTTAPMFEPVVLGTGV